MESALNLLSVSLRNSAEILGRFPFSQNFRKFRFGKKWKTFRQFVPLENSWKKWKVLKGRPVFLGGTFQQNFVFHLHISHTLYQFQ